ncbi:helix-turn-helix domain-containing protein [Membranihabitans marinus]|uniref:helix-turn-helix domain-containing protein n=1 Tax=Membranihabitans marinus TaxID=1227546 RepID=UPI001F434ED8|nr:helix-turn-helix domain-containing protein [Membranihabitans marinus]
MNKKNNLTLTNKQNGNLAFKIYNLENNHSLDHIQRLNYYSIIWIKKGRGRVKADFSEYKFEDNTMFSFSPYQPFMVEEEGGLQGVVINFHPDFFCIHKHHRDVACEGVLFNNIYNPPVTVVDLVTQSKFEVVIDQIIDELQNPALAQYELLISYLKIFLITASRLKAAQQSFVSADDQKNDHPQVLQKLMDYINNHYKTKHSASEYADMLAISQKALAKLTKTYFNKTLTDLIAERIVIEAKRELYLTGKTVKEIAYELGYDDEYYFSRFFKKNADVSPQLYRETVGFDRASVS